MFEVRLTDLGAEMLGWARYWWDDDHNRREYTYEVYGVHKEKDGSTSFLLYLANKDEWKWYPAIYFCT